MLFKRGKMTRPKLLRENKSLWWPVSCNKVRLYFSAIVATGQNSGNSDFKYPRWNGPQVTFIEPWKKARYFRISRFWASQDCRILENDKIFSCLNVIGLHVKHGMKTSGKVWLPSRSISFAEPTICAARLKHIASRSRTVRPNMYSCRNISLRMMIKYSHFIYPETAVDCGVASSLTKTDLNRKDFSVFW